MRAGRREGVWGGGASGVHGEGPTEDWRPGHLPIAPRMISLDDECRAGLPDWSAQEKVRLGEELELRDAAQRRG